VPLPEVSGTLAVGNGGTGLYHLLLVVYLEVMLGVISGFCCRYCCCYGATFVTNATNATNATNTVNVGVTNDAATATPVFFILGKCWEISLPKFQVLIYLLFLLLVFYQQDSQEMVLH
jgi:hypothetical protein